MNILNCCAFANVIAVYADDYSFVLLLCFIQKIICLEKEKEKYNHLLGEKDKEIQNLRDRLKSKNKNSEVSSLHSQLEEKTKEAERREQLLSSLSEEMNRLKCNLSTITAKCSEIESRTGSSQAFQVSTKVIVYRLDLEFSSTEHLYLL